MFKQLSAVLALILVVSLSQASITPSATVRATIDNVLKILPDTSLDEESRKNAALKEISNSFNFAGMSQRILATNWNKTSETQRQRFVELFSQILAGTYWRRIRTYSNQSVEVVGESIKDEKSARVKTIIKADSKNIPIDYSLQLVDGKWLAYDVTIEGVSLVRNYRASYQQIVQQEGIDGLLAKMEQKIADNKISDTQD